jgi:hypothetical protein
MKQLLSLSFILLVTLTSCDHNWEYAVITNESERSVTFKFKGVDSEETLTPGQSKKFDSYWTTSFDHYSNDKRVSYSYTSDYSSFHGVFEDIPPIEVHVNNKLDFPVSLRADGWMDEMIDIQPGSTDNSNHNGEIYTDKPKFNVISGTFPGMADFEIRSDGMMYVTIH